MADIAKRIKDTDDDPESDGTMLKSALMLTIEHWLEQYPDAPECLVLSILESLTADWREPLSNQQKDAMTWSIATKSPWKRMHF